MKITDEPKMHRPVPPPPIEWRNGTIAQQAYWQGYRDGFKERDHSPAPFPKANWADYERGFGIGFYNTAHGGSL